MPSPVLLRNKYIVFGSKRKETLLKQPRAIVKIINAQIETFNSSADYHLKFLTLTFSTWEQLCSLVFEKKVYRRPRIHGFLQLYVFFCTYLNTVLSSHVKHGLCLFPTLGSFKNGYPNRAECSCYFHCCLGPGGWFNWKLLQLSVGTVYDWFG